MWTGLAKRLQSTSCNFFKNTVNIVDNTQKIKNVVQNETKNIMNINDLTKITKYSSIF